MTWTYAMLFARQQTTHQNEMKSTRTWLHAISQSSKRANIALSRFYLEHKYLYSMQRVIFYEIVCVLIPLFFNWLPLIKTQHIIKRVNRRNGLITHFEGKKCCENLLKAWYFTNRRDDMRNYLIDIVKISKHTFQRHASPPQ
jgi:hypothetical protein